MAEGGEDVSVEVADRGELLPPSNERHEHLLHRLFRPLDRPCHPPCSGKQPLSEPVVEPGEGGHVAGSEAGDLPLGCVAVIHRFAPAAGSSLRFPCSTPKEPRRPGFCHPFFDRGLPPSAGVTGRASEGLFRSSIRNRRDRRLPLTGLRSASAGRCRRRAREGCCRPRPARRRPCRSGRPTTRITPPLQRPLASASHS